ncbi:GerAB/ArcD/ProY family transporter [Paenibacillus filicis]|uniref:GerAB/ArcD/ProY family transporter n=1 Tax=Paenibacillus gyeongsangnamensis TaxID=3388067 RepID=A0ABT4Q7M2_9BACL|nr:GerAB/ArcD/ProY family transporter [Paenibacillus filicis]MCZ8512862.1 GerAB/ArcD/ProY family transporter [Paenibacillus filicis]
MSEERISKHQLAMMIVLFEIGSTPLFMLGMKAKQDAWLAMSAAAIIGLLLLLLFLGLQKKERLLSLFGMLRKYFGRRFGSFLGWSYVVYFGYESMRNVRDFGELMNLSLLSETPKYAIMSIIVVISMYGLMKGLEVFFRLPEILVPLVFFSYAGLILLFAVAELVHFQRLSPVLEQGIGPVLQAAFPEIVSFPFGQMVIFLLFWRLVQESESIGKTTVCSYLSVAAFLIFMNALNLAVLGPALAGVSSFPFLQSVQLISVAEVFERMDVLMALLIFNGLLIKMMAFHLCAAMGIAELTSIPYQRWVIPVGLVIFATSFLEPSYTVHIWVGLVISVKIFTIFQIVIPVLLYTVMGIHGLYKKKTTA